METWIKPFVFGLTGFFALPFALGLLLCGSSGPESGSGRSRKSLWMVLILNAAGSCAVVFVISAFFFRTRTPWIPLERILRLECSWQEIGTLSQAVFACAAAAVPEGLILRRLTGGVSPAPGGRKAAALLLTLLCATMCLAGMSAARRSVRSLFISEICRKTTVRVADPERQEDLGGDGREICFVTLANPGPLECRAGDLYLSETEDEPAGIRFAEVVIPARGTRRLVMDFDHGLELKKTGGSTVFLSGSGGVIDKVQVPALGENEAWRMAAKDGEGEKYTYPETPYENPALPVFSHPGGFYAEGFELTLSAPEGMTVLYTLDGRDPAVYGTLCTGPVRIDDPTPSDNVWSARTDVSASLYGGRTRFTVPDGPVDKCATVRAVCTDAGGKTGRVRTESYFIGYENREGYDGLNIISIVTDPDNLFGEEKGIYILGDTFKGETIGENWWWTPANYHRRGREWEREASVQFFDVNRRLLLTKDIGIRVKGGSSAALLPKGLNLYARESYDGSSVFDADLFGNGYYACSLSLSGGGNDNALKVKDWLTARLARGLDIVTSRFVPCCVFLEGEYWGNCWLNEQYDETYFAFTCGLNPDNVVVFKNGELQAGVAEDERLAEELDEAVVRSDLSDPAAYERACGLADMDNFALCYALRVFAGDEDSAYPQKNTALWRTRTKENSPSGDTRWRWALFDVNHDSCYRNGQADTLSLLSGKDPMFRSLMRSPDFRMKFYAALEMLATEVFIPERAEEALEEFVRLMEKPLQLEYRRFSRNRKGLDGFDTIRTFIRERQEYILSLCEAFTVSGRAFSAR